MQRLLYVANNVVYWNNEIWLFPKVIILLNNLFNVIYTFVVDKSYMWKIVAQNGSIWKMPLIINYYNLRPC